MTLPLLTGCLASLDPIVDVVETAVGKDEPTVKSGMTSSDAAWASAYRAYAKSTERKAPQPILVIEAVDGREVTISNLKSLKVYAPDTSPQTVVKAPDKPKPQIVQVLDSVGSAAERIGRIWLPLRISEINAEVTREAHQYNYAERVNAVNAVKGAGETGVNAVKDVANTSISAVLEAQ